VYAVFWEPSPGFRCARLGINSYRTGRCKNGSAQEHGAGTTPENLEKIEDGIIECLLNHNGSIPWQILHVESKNRE
jgi:hypothetical protein